MNRIQALPGVLLILAVSLSVPALGQAPAADAPGMDDPIAYAESAGIPDIAAEATIIDAEGNILRQGTNEWTCMAIPDMPMCNDAQWMAMMKAWMEKDHSFKATSVGISYMLRGDKGRGASNTDPFATEPTPDNEWVYTGPHLMIIPPDPSHLAAYPTDPSAGGPYVMWRDTPFAHVMVPIQGNTVSMHGSGQ